MATKAVQFRRGTTSEHLTFTGLDGEITVDTDKNTIVVSDGSTAGGAPLAKEDMANVSQQDIANRGIAKDDVSNVSKSDITDKGIADNDLSNLTGAADTSLIKKGVVQLSTVSETITGTDETKATTPAGVNASIQNFLGLPILFINGGDVTNNSGAPTTTIDISSVVCRSNDNTIDISISAGSLNITTAANWATGSVPILTDTYSYVFALDNSGTPKFQLDNNKSGTNVSGKFRRIGFVMTDASSNPYLISTTLISGGGIDLTLKTIKQDFLDTTNVITRDLKTMTCPPNMIVKLNFYMQGSGSAQTLFEETSGSDTAVNAGNLTIAAQNTGDSSNIRMDIRVDSNSQIAKKGNGANPNQLRGFNIGVIDYRLD